MSESRARKTYALIEAALGEDRSSAISRVIQIIQELAGKAFSISVEDLSQLIGRDPTITERVISAANTLGFNPSGAQITTISEAIQTVGFEKIRNLAISLMLAENAGLNLNNYEQREAAALSVCTGMLAQSLANENDATIDPDLLFVCASLRNYGKLILSSFLIDSYREAQALALEMPEDDAFREVFGMTPLSLGRRLLRSTTVPKNIRVAMRETSTGALSREPANEEDRILLISALSGKICEAVFNNNVSPDAFPEMLEDAAAAFRRCFPVSSERVNQGLQEVESRFCQLNRIIGLRDDQSSSTMKLRARLAGQSLPEPPPQSRVSARAAALPWQQMSAEQREESAEASFLDAVNTISQKLVPGERVNLQEIYQIACKSIMDGLDLENCMAFVREEFDPQDLSARYGFGKLFDRVKNRPLVGPKKQDIFSICLARKEDVLIQDSKAGKIRSVIPEWIHLGGNVSSFLILPVCLEKNLFSILVGTVSAGRSIDLQDGDLRRLRIVRSHLSELKRLIADRAVMVTS